MNLKRFSNEKQITKFQFLEEKNILVISTIETILGKMIAVANENALFLLQFADYQKINKQFAKLKQNTKATFIQGRTKIIDLIEKEINLYLNGQIKEFKTPIILIGTPFEEKVWRALINIEYGKTESYLDVAIKIENPKAYRAVALANSKNLLVIIVPCHRIINNNGRIGGYASGLEKKQWLLDNEQFHK